MVGCFISLAGVVLVARPPFLFGGHEEWARSRSFGTLAGVVSAGKGLAAANALYGHCHVAAHHTFLVFCPSAGGVGLTSWWQM